MTTPIDVSFDAQVAPILFGDQEGESAPSMTVVAGQPGAGKSAVIPGLGPTAEPTPVVLSAENLAAFHPDFLDMRRRSPLEAQGAMAPLVSEWLASSLKFARTQRRSLVLEGSFPNPAPVLATAGVFAAEGFSTRLVVVAAKRSQSLLVAASRYLDLRRRGMPALFTDRETHNRGWIGAQALVREAAATAALDRLTVVDRQGRVLFDAPRAEGFDGAVAALETAESAPVTTLQAAEWFGELRRITEYARASRELAPPVADVLVELHELALNEVLPRIPVRPQSSFYVEQEMRLTRELVGLRQDATVEVAPRAITPPAPVFVPPAPSPSRGPSL